MRTAAAILALSVTLGLTAQAADEAKRIPHFKTGDLTITLLDTDGINPLAGAALTLTDAQSGDQVVEAQASKSGVCEINLENGRYVLGVDGKNITVVDASEQGDMDWARIIVNDSSMMVGGQAGETVATFTFLGLTGDAAVAAAVAAGVITVGAGGTIIYNEVDDDDDDDDPTPTTPTTPTSPSTPSTSSTPASP